jgi:geranylgeranyl reductase
VESCEALVIGAGPAGLSCGLTLVKKGFKTVLIERTPSDLLASKPCAEGITRRFLFHPFMDALPGAFEPLRVSWIVPQKKGWLEVCLPWMVSGIKTFSKNAWLKGLLEGFQKTGGQFYDGCPFLGFDAQKKEAYFQTPPYKIRFRYLVGADGFSSRVRRSLEQPCFFGTVWQADVVHDLYHLYLIGSFEEIPFGYAYVFPHKGHAKVGFGVVPALGKGLWPDVESFKRTLTLLFGFSWPIKFKTGLINLAYRGYAFGGIYLAGEAAGLTLDITGEGIGPAVVSGEAVGLAISGARKEASDRVKWLLGLKRAQSGLIGLQIPFGMLGKPSFRLFGLGVAFLLARNPRAGILERTLIG